MVDTTKMGVVEIRALLVENGLSKEEAEAIKGKAELVAKLGEFADTEAEEILETAELVDDVATDVDPNAPARGSKEWTDYVLAELDEDEKRDGHPTVDGLRRLVELFVGEITTVWTDVVQAPNPENQYCAVVKVDITAGFKQFSGAADVNAKNTDSLYAKHSTATAESRAEGRALRKLLGLKGVLAAEEIVKESDIVDPYDKIKDSQISMINITAQKLDLDVVKWLEKKNISVAQLENVSNSKAIELCGELNGLRATGVPDDVKGYNSNWR